LAKNHSEFVVFGQSGETTKFEFWIFFFCFLKAVSHGSDKGLHGYDASYNSITDAHAEAFWPFVGRHAGEESCT
jgi:hypothetical protein